ncbi:MAG: hypothetical protein RBJ76_00865 [Stenomitos frigidus ULC029]
MPKGIIPKCRACAKLSANEAIALHGTEGTGCWVSAVCPKRRYYYRNRELLNKKRRKGAANDPIELLPPTAPAAILHLYRDRVDAPLHAVGAELWVGQKRQQTIAAMHCLGLTPGQIATHLQAVLQRLGEECDRPLDKFAAQVELHPSQCPIDPCPLHKSPPSLQPVAKQQSNPAPKPPPPVAEPKQVMQVRLWLRVENNSKFVRGKSKVRAAIEQWVLQQFGMEKLQKDGYEYLLSIPCDTEEELERIIYKEIYAEMESIADYRHCFIEGDLRAVDNPERSW